MCVELCDDAVTALGARLPALEAGLRFSMKARRPSLKSSLSKQASAIFSSFLWSCCDSGLAISRAAALASAIVSGAFWAIASVVLATSASSSASAATPFTRPIS